MRLLHLRQSGAQNCQLSEALGKGQRERIRVDYESHYGSYEFPEYQLGKLGNLDRPGTKSAMMSSSEGVLNFIVEPEGRYVEAENGKLLPMVGGRQLDIVAEQARGPVT